MPSLTVRMDQQAIVAKTRKLKASWTPEFAQDLNAYHSLDAESELTSMLSEYVSLEIDLEILSMLLLNAITVEHWSAKIGQSTPTPTVDPYFGSQDDQQGRALAYVQKDRKSVV